MRCFSQAFWLLSMLLYSSVFRNILLSLFGFYSNDTFSESSDKICWIIEEGKDLPISKELQNTVRKLRSLVESELGEKYISILKLIVQELFKILDFIKIDI